MSAIAILVILAIVFRRTRVNRSRRVFSIGKAAIILVTLWFMPQVVLAAIVIAVVFRLIGFIVRH